MRQWIFFVSRYSWHWESDCILCSRCYAIEDNCIGVLADESDIESTSGSDLQQERLVDLIISYATIHFAVICGRLELNLHRACKWIDVQDIQENCTIVARLVTGQESYLLASLFEWNVLFVSSISLIYQSNVTKILVLRKGKEVAIFESNRCAHIWSRHALDFYLTQTDVVD